MSLEVSTDKKTKNLILLMGQSNMAGRGMVDDVEPIEDERITKSWFDVFRPAADPLFIDKWSAGVGPGMSFSKRVLEEYPDINIGLVTAAVGGSSLGRWKRGDFLYKRAILMAEQALNFGEIKGILWHQGESDCGKDPAGSYAERFVEMMTSFQKDLGITGVPLILGELADFLPEANQPYWKTVNSQLHKIADEIKNCKVVKAEGFGHIGDDLHIDAVSQRKFGLGYAEKYLELVKSSGLEFIKV
ncbi:MAG: sialate O-acetylesterase [Planctomycetota bacterium]